ncbi:MAG: cysteine desulfurase family protein [bacterium]|nr:cysteine desulfurase family protein [bacterium]
MKSKQVYLDNASTTPVDPRVLKAMLPYFKERYGNPSSLHALGRESKNAIETARKNIAKHIGAEPEEIIFTSGGTESDNLAMFGIARAYKEKGKHVIVSGIEHKAILDACKKLEKEGFEITYLDVDKKGLVSLEKLSLSLRRDTILVSIMYANNEIGTIQPIKEIAKIIQEFKTVRHCEESATRQSEKTNRLLRLPHNDRFNNNSLFPIFHTDACQAASALPIKAKELGADALTMSSSKIYGPKGIGCLYLNKKYSSTGSLQAKIEPIIFGGGQERGLRSGTENVAGIVGFSEALSISEKKRVSESKRLIKLRDYFLRRIQKEIDGVLVNGDIKQRLPNNINVSIKGVEGESLLLLLDRYGIYCSTGSACSSLDLSPSYVLLSIGLPLELAHCSVRFTLGRYTKKGDIDYTMKVLVESVKKIRGISSIK